MVSRSRCYNRQLFRAKRLAPSLGSVGIVSAAFFKIPRFGGFRDVMDHPLLLDMALHRFVFPVSWCGPGQETSWTAAWPISGGHGTVRWDGNNEPVPTGRGPAPYIDDGQYGGIMGI